ncbi:MAG: hypothetical protein AABW68_05245 [archaeon]
MSIVRVPASSIHSLLSPSEREALGFPSSGELEFKKGKGEWILSPPGLPLSPLHSKVLRLIQSHQAHELIEGRFEGLLSAEELHAFEELKGLGKVVIYKSNPRFDKGIYRVAGEGKSSPGAGMPPSPSLVERPMDEYSLVGDGFQVLRTEGAAKAASFDLSERIRGGEVKGIKSFDGFYYLIENALLQKHSERILGLLSSQKKADLPTIASAAGIPILLARIVVEFAKEEGSVIEKQKNIFFFVG